MRAASIDLGTNSCNLLVAEYNGNSTWDFLYQDRQPVNLGKEGFPGDALPQTAVQRIIRVFLHYRRILKTFQIDETFVAATSGLRNALNREEVVRAVLTATGFHINVLSGAEEAAFTFQGIRHALSMDNLNAFLLDIGGGSNEMMLISDGRLVSQHSVDIGIARLLKDYSITDPPQEEKLAELHRLFDAEMPFLSEWYETYTPQIIVGSSGSFDSFACLHAHHINCPEKCEQVTAYEIPMEYYMDLHQRLITSTRDERIEMPGMELMRVDMIPLASFFTYLLVKKFHFVKMIRSSYALKEGIIFNLAGNLRKQTKS